MRKYSIPLLLIPLVLLASIQEEVDHHIQPEDLIYVGAFKLPDDGYPGSIFATGHAWEHQVSEISIRVWIVRTEDESTI